ncbi:SNF2 family N-terminal domain-containing protein [Xylariaceae sp. FL1019]|nr:SNF2 family N-terminal domain-containing protein [Xylariaceae sp. FL1019]
MNARSDAVPSVRASDNDSRPSHAETRLDGTQEAMTLDTKHQHNKSTVSVAQGTSTSAIANDTHHTGAKRKHEEPQAIMGQAVAKKSKITLKTAAMRRLESNQTPEEMLASIAQTSSPLYMSPKEREDKLRNDENEMRRAVDYLENFIEETGQEDDFPNKIYRLRNTTFFARDYQLHQVAKMRRTELSRRLPHRGGIVADDTGVGKTYQTIGCIHVNPPTRKKLRDGVAANLIVVPSQSLIEQWADELVRTSKEDISGQIMRYAAKNGTPTDSVRHARYVLVTYSALLADYKGSGTLFKVMFRRIILDEGDNIKNISGKWSKVCAELQGKYKWVLTGTPLRNNKEEALPYFRFIGIDMDQSRREFEAIFDPLPEDTTDERIRRLMLVLMTRRMKGDMFMGRQICKLPESQEVVLKFPLSKEESMVYEAQSNTMSEEAQILDGNAELGLRDEKDPSVQDVFRGFCLKLRQASNHTFHLESSLRAEEIRPKLPELMENIEDIKPRVSLYNQLMANWDGANQLEPRVADNQDPGIQDLGFDITQYLADIMIAEKHVFCLECRGTDNLKKVSTCDHLICIDCFKDLINECQSKGKRKCRCPQCGSLWANVTPPKKGAASSVSSVASPNIQHVGIQNFGALDGHNAPLQIMGEPTTRLPGDDMNGYQPHLERHSSGCRWLEQCDADKQVIASTKIILAAELIRTWLIKAPEDKIVVFVEWNLTACVLGRVLDLEGVKYVYYWGDMSLNAKTKSLEDFRDHPEAKIMVTSKNAGSVGLNITCANKAIIMAPWFNAGAELQAFGRIKRHGQKKETLMVRLIAEGTIDEDLLELQEGKNLKLADALNPDSPHKGLTKEDYFRMLVSKRDHMSTDDGSVEDSDSPVDDHSEDDTDYEP